MKPTKTAIVGVHSILLALVALAWLSSAGTAKEPPKEVVFESKLGNVTFDHAKHVEREKGECVACHDKLFPQSRAPLKYGAGMHKPAEAKKESCAACHVDGGQAFASKGNCKNCHVK